MEVRWALKAVKDLDHNFKRIRQDNPESARKVIQTLYEGCISLAEFLQHGDPDACKGAAS